MVCCSSFFGALFEGGGRDVRPAAHLLSFASPKESRQRKGDPQSASLRFAAGNLRCSDLGWRRRTRCVLRTPLKQLRRARQRSACVLRHTHPPQLLRFSAQPAGVGSGVKDGCCFAAAPGVGDARDARCRRAGRSRPAQAERSDGAPGRAKQWPVWSPLPPPSDRAEKRRAWGERVPKDTRIVIWLAEAV
ncbi:hypothetical protein D3C71_1521120 [compost metagenome]